MSEPQLTPLHARHVALGARMVDFAGFSMPVQYTSIKAEHAAIREAAGLFDVSHMGQIHFSGPAAVEAVERLVTCRVANLGVGRVRYGVLCNDEGGCVDDVTVYREADDALFLCVNAANIAKDEAWVRAHAAPGTDIANRSDDTGLLALQGPASTPLLEKLCTVESGPAITALPRFGFGRYRIAGASALVSATGYTGSAGYELYLGASDAGAVWDALLEAGHGAGLVPAGLGARDTLRLEAALPLYGHELDDSTSPLEAGLDRFVKRRQGGFIGAEAIEARAHAGHPRRLVGFEMVGRGIARADHAIMDADRVVGRVTSGAPSPTLGKSIGLGYVPPALADPGRSLSIDIRDKQIEARVVETPFIAKVDAPNR